MDLTLFSGCALFVCNKWDLIDDEEREEVKKAQIGKLTKRLGNLNPTRQIVFLSCKNAQLAQKYGVFSEDFNDLITGISNLVVSSMQNNLLMYSRWLEDLLAHVSRHIRVSLKTARMSHQQTEINIKRVMKRMEKLKISQQCIYDELSKHQSQKFEEILEKLASHFKSEETIKKFCEWSIDEVPAALESWKETKSEALKYVSKRTHQFVKQWEDDKHEFAKAQVELIQYCCERYDVMQEEIHQVEDKAFLEDSPADATQEEEGTRSKPRETTAPRLLFSPPVHPSSRREAHYKKKLESYTDDPCDYMSKRSRKCLKVIAATQDRLLPFVSEQLEDAVQFLRQIKEKIPKLREGDEQLYQQLLEDKRSKTELQEIFEPLNQHMEWLQRGLTVYNLREVRKSDFTKEELKCDERWESIIGNGSFSTVYKGVLAREGKPEINVALKRYRDPLTIHNVRHFVDEELALRQLTHPNVVTFYGSDLRQGPNGTTAVIVLELCNCTLRSQMSHSENAPARLFNETVKKKVLGWAQDILAGLRYIHSEGFVHRDLKLDNILLTHDERVKLADVGVAKHEKEITGTICGTSLYLAPEVFDGQIYNSKADMYSLGFVLWELWYGETAFRTEIAIKPQSVLLEDVMRREVRPTHIEGTQQPWGIWKEVMTSCWNKEPRSRLTAQEGWEYFKKLQVQQELPPPLPPRTSSAPRPLSRIKTPPAVKPKPGSRRKTPGGMQVSYHQKEEDGTVHFESQERSK